MPPATSSSEARFEPDDLQHLSGLEAALVSTAPSLRLDALFPGHDLLSDGASSQALAHELQSESLKLLVIDFTSYPTGRKCPMFWTDL